MASQIQWGSENLTSPDFEWWKVAWMANGQVFDCHKAIARPFENQKFKWSGLQLYISYHQLFENRTFCFKWLQFGSIFKWLSYSFCPDKLQGTKMFGFRMFPELKCPEFRSPLGRLFILDFWTKNCTFKLQIFWFLNGIQNPNYYVFSCQIFQAYGFPIPTKLKLPEFESWSFLFWSIKVSPQLMTC